MSCSCTLLCAICRPCMRLRPHSHPALALPRLQLAVLAVRQGAGRLPPPQRQAATSVGTGTRPGLLVPRCTTAHRTKHSRRPTALQHRTKATPLQQLRLLHRQTEVPQPLMARPVWPTLHQQQQQQQHQHQHQQHRAPAPARRPLCTCERRCVVCLGPACGSGARCRAWGRCNGMS